MIFAKKQTNATLSLKIAKSLMYFLWTGKTLRNTFLSFVYPGLFCIMRNINPFIIQIASGKDNWHQLMWHLTTSVILLGGSQTDVEVILEALVSLCLSACICVFVCVLLTMSPRCLHVCARAWIICLSAHAIIRSWRMRERKVRDTRRGILLGMEWAVM